jgi:hypothetical protein
MTVTGSTMSKADRQSPQTSRSQAQKKQSTALNFGRFFAERWSTPI